MESALRKWLFLARVASQPRNYAYRLSLSRACKRSGKELNRYIEDLSQFRKNRQLLDEWSAAAAEVRFLRRQYPDTRELYRTVYFDVYQRLKPLDYVFKDVTFCGLRIHVKPPVLIPRPDTECWLLELLSELKSLHRPLKILEIGTGTGGIPLAIAHHIADCKIISIDVSSYALRLAKANMMSNMDYLLSRNISFEKRDIFTVNSLDQMGHGSFDIVVSNPPYIPKSSWIGDVSPSVKRWESQKALIGGDDVHGLQFHRKLIELFFADPHVKTLVMEMDGTQSQLSHLLNFLESDFVKSHNYSYKILQDYSKRPRTIMINKKIK